MKLSDFFHFLQGKKRLLNFFLVERGQPDFTVIMSELELIFRSLFYTIKLSQLV